MTTFSPRFHKGDVVLWLSDYDDKRYSAEVVTSYPDPTTGEETIGLLITPPGAPNVSGGLSKRRTVFASALELLPNHSNDTEAQPEDAADPPFIGPATTAIPPPEPQAVGGAPSRTYRPCRRCGAEVDVTGLSGLKLTYAMRDHRFRDCPDKVQHKAHKPKAAAAVPSPPPAGAEPAPASRRIKSESVGTIATHEHVSLVLSQVLLGPVSMEDLMSLDDETFEVAWKLIGMMLRRGNKLSHG